MADMSIPNTADQSDSSSEDEFFDSVTDLSKDGKRVEVLSSGDNKTDSSQGLDQSPANNDSSKETSEGLEHSLDTQGESQEDLQSGVESLNLEEASTGGDQSVSEKGDIGGPSLEDNGDKVCVERRTQGSAEDFINEHDPKIEKDDGSQSGSDSSTDGREQLDRDLKSSGSTFHEGLAAEAAEPEEGEGGSSGGGLEGVDEGRPQGDEDEDGEEALRQLEEQLTEEEKQERRDQAQELKKEGNDLYKLEEYLDAIHKYTEAVQLCPLAYKKERSIMFANRAACKIRLEQLDAGVKDCTKALDLHPHYMKVILRRAQAYELLEKLDEALGDYQKALELDPGCHQARAACMRLPDQINERNEKLKAEMIDKLKDLGNMVLRPFGLSTNNFQMQQDPNTGSYSVNFVQNNKTNGK